MGVASGCGEQEVGVASRSGWNLWVWLLGVVLRRYIDFLILLTLLLLYISVLFCSSIPTFLFILEGEKIAIFYFARRVRKIALYSDLIHSFDWKSAVKHDGGV